ncbi:MAG TPA: ABC transporter permease [Vicinamibacterales bacterium]|nr:ABC transporter permease [Vicinamibacterales bacterium]
MTGDLRVVLRRLTAEPGFSAMAIITLALGIGANTAIFSLIRTVLIRPLPYGDPARIVVIWNTREADSTTWLSTQEVFSYANDSTAFEHVAAIYETEANLTGGQEPERIRGAFVTWNLFETLGVRPMLGRTFTEAEAQRDPAYTVLLSYGLWKRRFGGDPAIVGQSVQLNGNSHAVVGVMPESFRLPLDYRKDRPTEVWTPYAIDPADLGGWGDRSLVGVGRLRPGATAASATSELAVIAGRWIRAGYVADQGDFRFSRSAVPVQEFVTGRVRTPLLILLGTVGLVLLIAVATVANLLLARADLRSRDLAIRSALGARRGRLVRQLLAESVLLGACGSSVGLAFAYAGIRIASILQPSSLPRVEGVQLDGIVLAFTAGLGIVAGLVFGLAPAVHLSRPDLASILHDGGRSGTASRTRRAVRKALVVAQMALSVVLVLGAGLLTRSLIELNRVDVGFDASHVLTAQIQLPPRDYPRPDAVIAFYRNLAERLEGIPGVSSAGAIRILPLTRTIGDWSITLEGRPYSPAENPNGDFQWVTPGYFTAMGLRLVRGRFPTNADREDAPMVVVINETMAARYWPGEDALGRRFHLGTKDQPWLTIVGIVADVRHNAIVEEPRAEMYLPHAQVSRETGGIPRAMAIVARTESNPLAMVDAVRRTIRTLDPNLPISDIRTMEQVMARALSEQRFMAVLLGAFATLALVLAAVGVYGTISLLVTERTREIGIRMALGAGREAILRMVLSEAVVLAAAGLAIGLAGGAALTRSLDNLLYGIAAHDPLTFAVIPVVLITVALIASFHPARRAARLDPIATLRR